MNFIGSYFGQVASNSPPRFHEVIPRQQLSPTQKTEILKSLAKYEVQYNGNESMIKHSYSWSPGTYHTV